MSSLNFANILKPQGMRDCGRRGADLILHSNEQGEVTMRLITKFLINAAALAITAYILPGITFSGLGTLLLAALILGILNAVIKPILVLLTLPLNLLTLGLFTFIINGLILYLTAAIVGGFTISSFWTAVLGAIILSITSMILNAVM